jgi:hypothetical protein
LKIGKLIGLAKVEFDKHSPEILTGFGVAGMFASVIFSVRATTKATKAVEAKKKELNKEKLTVGETIKAAWKYYIPTAITLAGSTACIIGANSVNTRRNAALAAAYTLSETALQEYQDKVKEVVGERKENDIRADIERDKLRADPPRATQVEFVNQGDQLFKDSISGRYFRSTYEKVMRAERDLQRQMLPGRDPFDIDDGYITMDDIYISLGLEANGDDRRWYLKDGYVEFKPRAILMDNGDTCTVLTYGGRRPKDKYFA